MAFEGFAVWWYRSEGTTPARQCRRRYIHGVTAFRFSPSSHSIASCRSMRRPRHNYDRSVPLTIVGNLLRARGVAESVIYSVIDFVGGPAGQQTAGRAEIA